MDRVVEYRVKDETGKIPRKERYAYDIRGNKSITEVSVKDSQVDEKVIWSPRSKPRGIRSSQRR